MNLDACSALQLSLLGSLAVACFLLLVWAVSDFPAGAWLAQLLANSKLSIE